MWNFGISQQIFKTWMAVNDGTKTCLKTSLSVYCSIRLCPFSHCWQASVLCSWWYCILSGLHHQGIFRVSGSQVEINNFRESFERGEDPLADVTDASDINSVAGVLKLYLRELREPLFPIIYFEHFMDLARECFYLCVELSLFVQPYGATSLSCLFLNLSWWFATTDVMCVRIVRCLGYLSRIIALCCDVMHVCVCFSELESKHDFVVKMKELVQSLPRSVVIVMRYLFAFLNQWVLYNVYCFVCEFIYWCFVVFMA